MRELAARRMAAHIDAIGIAAKARRLAPQKLNRRAHLIDDSANRHVGAERVIERGIGDPLRRKRRTRPAHIALSSDCQ